MGDRRKGQGAERRIEVVPLVLPGRTGGGAAGDWSPASGTGPTGGGGSERSRGGDGSGRGSAVGFLGGMAVALVIVLVVVLAWRTDRGRDEAAPATTSTTVPSPDSALERLDGLEAPAGLGASLAPGSVPDGLRLWAVDASADDGFDGGAGRRVQLFGPPGGASRDVGKVLVEIDEGIPDRTDEGRASGEAERTVRGQTAVGRSSEALGGSGGTLEWHERGAALSVRYRGMAEDAAVALLDGLAWRSAVAADGLEPVVTEGPDGVVDDGVVILAEAGPDPAGGPPVPRSVLSVTYRSDPAAADAGEGRQLVVRTRSAAGGLTERYVAALLDGVRGPDGSVTTFARDLTSGGEVHWPDGTEVSIDANGTPLDPTDRAAVLAGLIAVDADGVRALRDQAAANVAAAMVPIHSATVGAATVDVRAVGDVRSLCVAVERTTRCSAPVEPPAGAPGEPPGGLLVVDALVDGTWYLTAAAQGSFAVLEPAASSVPVRPSDTAVAGGWTVVVAQPPDRLSTVEIRNGSDEDGVLVARYRLRPVG